MTIETVQPGEVWLASRDPDTGALLRGGRFRLAAGTRVISTFQGLNPPVVAIGEQGRDTQPFASTITFADCSGGIGVLQFEADKHVGRVWWATADIRYRRQVTLLKRKVDKGKPAGVTTELPRRGGVYGGQVWVAWNGTAYIWTESGGWSVAQRTFTGTSSPVGDPVEWEGGWFWPLGGSIDYFNGTVWVNIAKSCVGLLVYANTLWGVSAGGQVFSTNIGASAAATKIAAGTLAAADVTDRVRISDTCSGLIMYTTADQQNDVVPYVVGTRALYQVDAAGAAPTYLAAPAGPQLPPNRWPIDAAALGGDNALYLSQGNGVVQWSGTVARAVGLDSDDGVPVEYRGGIVRLLNGGQSLFALIDATRANAATTLDAYDTGQPFATGVLQPATGYSWLASREGEGWVVRAAADATGSGATCLFLSTAEGTYRAWFAWTGTLYAIDLEQSLYNPTDDPTGEYEASGDLYYPALDFTYRENSKIGLLVQVRTLGCSATETVQPYLQFEQSGTWYPLYNADGSGHGIASDGLHSFLVAANPVPVTTNPLVFADDPPVGKAHNQSQLWLRLARGSALGATPRVIHATTHAIKAVAPLTGWTLTVDLSSAYDGRTPWQHEVLLDKLVDDNGAGLLHFAHLPDPDAATPGTADLRAVRVTGFSGTSTSGLAADFDGTARMSLSEARKV